MSFIYPGFRTSLPKQNRSPKSFSEKLRDFFLLPAGVVEGVVSNGFQSVVCPDLFALFKVGKCTRHA